MTDRTEVPERVSERATTARRGRVSGQQAVSDYVGQPAGEAAQAVRRLGLRPGLDRSFGCAAELIGLVVAQDPAAGTDLARNGMVTLYVAAPGGDSVEGEAGPVAGGASDGELVASELIEDRSTGPAGVPVRARRRKPGLACRTAAPSELPPPPTIVNWAPQEDPPVEAAGERSAEWLGEIEQPQSAVEGEFVEELGERRLPDDELVVHAEDLLAGRSGPCSWRRAYPRRRGVLCGLGSGGRVLVWLRAHRMFASAVAVALVLWTVVGVTSMLARRGAGSPPGGGAVSRAVAGMSDRKPALKQAGEQRSTKRATPAQAWQPYRARRGVARAEQQGPARRRSVPRPVHRMARAVPEAATSPVAASADEASAPQTAEAPAPSVSRPSESVPEQQGGGVFSP